MNKPTSDQRFTMVPRFPDVVSLAVVGLLSVAVSGSILRAFAQEPPPQAGLRSVWDGVYTEEQSTRGRTAYEQECVSCHGVTLGGDERAPALAGDQFMAELNGKTVGDLFEYTLSTMPQDSPGRLSRQQYGDIIAYLLSKNELPAGRKELDHEIAALKQIRWESKPK